MPRSITPAVHPDVTDHAAARRGIAVARGVLEGLRQAEDALAEDPTLTPAARLTKLGEYVGRRRSEGTRALDAALADLRREISAEDAKIAATMKPPREFVVGQEFRHRLAAMTKEQRREVLEDALRNGSGETMGAALALPPWIVGLTPAEAASYRSRWAAEHAPDAVERIRYLRTVTEHVERAGAAYMGDLEKVQSRAKQATEAAARTKEALSVD